MSMISKQVADLREYADERKGELANMINRAADTIEALSAKRTGEWIVEEKDCIYGKKIRLTCSECGDVFDVTEAAYPYERYCRYCGAKMKG